MSLLRGVHVRGKRNLFFERQVEPKKNINVTLEMYMIPFALAHLYFPAPLPRHADGMMRPTMSYIASLNS